MSAENSNLKILIQTEAELSGLNAFADKLRQDMAVAKALGKAGDEGVKQLASDLTKVEQAIADTEKKSPASTRLMSK